MPRCTRGGMMGSSSRPVEDAERLVGTQSSAGWPGLVAKFYSVWACGALRWTCSAARPWKAVLSSEAVKPRTSQALPSRPPRASPHCGVSEMSPSDSFSSGETCSIHLRQPSALPTLIRDACVTSFPKNNNSPCPDPSNCKSWGTIDGSYRKRYWT